MLASATSLMLRPRLHGPTKGRRSPLPPAGLVDSAAPALVCGEQLIDHGTLRARVNDAAAQLPPVETGRRLVQMPLTRTPEAVIAYFAALEAGHCALVCDEARVEALDAAWPADFVFEKGQLRPATTQSANVEASIPTQSANEWAPPQHLLHPDLAVLLSTSGSTGSPKLVRLSHTNIVANADAIAAALRLTSDDRGITSLPLHYCYGLSVVHAHLSTGGAVVLSEDSVLDDAFWQLIDRAGVTTLATVPHLIELIETTGVLERPHPSLRLITQAGGRMAPDRVTRVAALGREQGWGLSVMYGQTEATARICVHDPADVLAAPEAVGHPVPGTELSLDLSVPEAQPDDGIGEVVVHGPGVMMGYAEQPDDLALGPMLGQLYTGDLGRIDATGVLRIVGRRSGFVKILGIRIDLGQVERRLERDGYGVSVTGDDETLRIAVEPIGGVPDETRAADVRKSAAQVCRIGVGHVSVAVLQLPRLSNGKVDRAGCDALVRAAELEECRRTQERVDAPTIEVQVAAAVAALLGATPHPARAHGLLDASTTGIDLNSSFVALGGDSLSHVQACLALTRILGPLPADWHHRTLADLCQLRPEAGKKRAADASTSGPAGDEPHSRPGWLHRSWRRLAGETVRLESSIVLRALAVILICGSHADLFRLVGGAHTLLAVAGYNAARFGLSAPGVRGRWRGTTRLVLGVAVPTMAVALFGLSYGRYGWDNVFLVNWLVGDIAYGFHNELWFVDALLACLILTTAVLSLPPVARVWRVHPWRVAFGLLLVTLVPRFVILSLADGVLRGMMPTVFWLFAAGLALAHADTPRRRGWTLAATALGIAWFFPDDPIRNATILAGIAVLALVPAIALPSRMVPLVTVLAAASLQIYLIQFQILGWVPTPLLATVAALAAGVLLWRLTATPVRRLQDRLLPTMPRATSDALHTPETRLTRHTPERIRS